MGALGVYAAFTAFSDDWGRGMMLFVAAWIIAMRAHFALWTPHTIRWNGDGTLEFQAYLQRRKVAATDIRSIEPSRINGQDLVVHVGKTKIVLGPQFTGLHELLALLKAAHPDVTLRGC